MMATLGCKCTLLSRVQPLIHQPPQVLLGRAALHMSIPQPLLILGVASAQVQHLGLVKLNEIPMGLLLELVQVPLKGIQSFRSANSITSACKLAAGALNLFV